MDEQNVTAELRVSQSMFNNPNEGSAVDLNAQSSFPKKVLASSKRGTRRRTPKKSPKKRLNKTGSKKLRTLQHDFTFSPN